MADVCLVGPLNQTIQVKRLSAQSRGGQETLATATLSMKADVQIVDDLISVTGGAGKKSGHLIITRDQIFMDDRIALPWDSFSPTDFTRVPHSVRELYDFNGAVSHYETKI